MARTKCLHCEVINLIKAKSETDMELDLKHVIVKLCEVIGDGINEINSHKDRADLYEFWGEAMIEIMEDIEYGEFK